MDVAGGTLNRSYHTQKQAHTHPHPHSCTILPQNHIRTHASLSSHDLSFTLSDLVCRSHGLLFHIPVSSHSQSPFTRSLLSYSFFHLHLSLSQSHTHHIHNQPSHTLVYKCTRHVLRHTTYTPPPHKQTKHKVHPSTIIRTRALPLPRCMRQLLPAHFRSD
jgi:hypothetical protein